LIVLSQSEMVEREEDDDEGAERIERRRRVARMEK
jgi:hypothetical protein